MRYNIPYCTYTFHRSRTVHPSVHPLRTDLVHFCILLIKSIKICTKKSVKSLSIFTPINVDYVMNKSYN